ncbi:hypothetical protein BsWGS_07299 [Bradybaena similaris]
MRRVMAFAASANVKGHSKSGGYNTSPSLSPSPPLRLSRRYGSTSRRTGYQSDSECGIVAGMHELNLQQKDKSSTKQFENRRTFCSNGSNVILRKLADVATMLKNGQAKNVVIVAGAGISTPSGIPDFRTPGSGLYDNLQQYNIPYPEAIFDIDFFHHNPRPFFALAKELYPSGKYRPNYVHYFARLLSDRGILLRLYTQNIDGLERLAGVPPEKLVEAHGTFSSASCIVCQEKYRGSDIKESIFEDKLPTCKKRGCYGIVKPDIVFFGEELPKRFYYYLKDMLQTDMVLVMGTSLEVQPFAGIIDTVRWTVPRVLFNRDAVGPFRHGKRAKDFVSPGDILECLQSFAHAAGFKEDMEDLITRSEGTFRLAAPPTPAPEPAQCKPASRSSTAPKTDPVLAAMWRQNARANIFSDSESSDSSDLIDTETDSSSSSEKRPVNKPASSLQNGKAAGDVKPQNLKQNYSSSSTNMINNGGDNLRSLSSKPPKGAGDGKGNGSGQTRNFSSLLSRRKGDRKAQTPILFRRQENSYFQSQNGIAQTQDDSWIRSTVRRKPQIDINLKPQIKPALSSSSQGAKPRSSSGNKAASDKTRSSRVGGIRAVIDRMRSVKPPQVDHAAKAGLKSAYDAQALAFNVSNSSSSDDDDDDYRDDIDDNSTSDDSQ